MDSVKGVKEEEINTMYRPEADESAEMYRRSEDSDFSMY